MIIKQFEQFNNIPREDLFDEIELCFHNLIDDYDIRVKKRGADYPKYDKENNPFRGEWWLYDDIDRNRWNLEITMPHLMGDKKREFLKKLEISKHRLNSAGFSIYSGWKTGQRDWNHSIYRESRGNKALAVNRWDFGIYYQR